MRSYLFSGYPLSRSYRDRLESKVHRRLESIQLLELRQKGAMGMLRALRRLTGEDLYIAHEEPSSKAILPLLRIVAAMTRVRNQFVVDEDFHVTPIRRLAAAVSMLGLAAASLTGLAMCAGSMLRAHRLLRLPRARVILRGRRVLYLNANLWFGLKAGGSVGHISGVTNGFAHEGYDAMFCSASGRLMVDERIPLLQLQAPNSFGLPWEANYYAFDKRVVAQVEYAAKQFKPSFIYQRMSLANTSGVSLSRRLGVPLVLEYNGSEVWIARNWGKPLKLERAGQLAEDVCFKHAHLLVTVSEALRQDLRARGVEDSRIVVYPNCIDPHLFDSAKFSHTERIELRGRYAIEADATVVTFIGSFGQWHGVPVLASVIRRMIEDDPAWLDKHTVRFLLVGDGLKMPEVLGILGDFAKSKYVRVVGMVPQHTAPLHLAASDILSSPHTANVDGSKFFGSPTKLFEYMAMGKAIVASDLDQIGEVLRHSLRVHRLPTGGPQGASELAVLCKPGSVEEHAAGIRFLVDQPSWRHTLGHNARREALDRYTWSKHVQHIVAGLRSVPDLASTRVAP
jgi:glycosyltransferase involved in cell wall biosynthesis